MIKCFLSHSSSDKELYVRPLAARLRTEVKVFDEETFEEGMAPAEEILHGLDESSLFVIFISRVALASKWVREELAEAKLRHDDSRLARIYPIIIDPTIRYDDPEIPSWMREALNIQPILRYTIAARKINSRLVELSWANHPRLKQRKEIFVGRNELIQKFEERFDDFTQHAPIGVVASGLPAIGRKSLLKYAAGKANLVRDSYEFPVISLSPYDGIEDFVLKISDLGFIPETFTDIRKAKSFHEKLDLAKQVCAQIVIAKERLLIEDHGVLVQIDRELVDWFSEILSHLSGNDHLTFLIASQFRPNNSINRTNPLVYSLHVPELDIKERNGLLTRYAKFHELEMGAEDLKFFSDILTGYPEQVLYTVDLIKEQGFSGARKSSHNIQQYASDKAKVVVDTLKEDQNILEFVYLLSKFEFISYESLFEIVDVAEYGPLLDRLLALSVCERMGNSSDYVRVNEVIRDYVDRSRFRLPTKFDEAIKAHVKNFLETYSDEVNSDVSDYIFSTQEALRNGQDVPDDFLLPSIFLRSIRKLYQDRSYLDAIHLADRILLRETYLHKNTVNYIRYTKCQSLAKLRDSNFFSEVMKIPETDRSFLHGFYYRLAGQYAKAEESLKRVINSGRRDAAVVGELAQVYMQSEEYEQALELTRENYRLKPSNPVNAFNYFTCLIRKERTQERYEELTGIIKRLAFDSSERAQEILSSFKASFCAYYEGDKAGSILEIEEAIKRFPHIPYPMLNKADLATHFHDKELLRQAVSALEGVVHQKTYTRRAYVRYKAILLAMDGKLLASQRLIEQELKGLSQGAYARLNDQLIALSGASEGV